MKWERIDTAPTDGTLVLLSDGDWVDCGYWDSGDWCAYPDDTSPHTDYCHRCDTPPTHWMLLPDPPTD